MEIYGKKIQEVVILDPGLREFGGHHPAIIEGLAYSHAIVNKKIKVTVLANKGCSRYLITSLSKGAVNVIPYFQSDFYCNFYSQEKISYFNDYIRVLAREYFQAIYQYKDKAVVFLYHTLNWEHAAALSLAITLYQERGGKRHWHLVCLMYNPHSNRGKVNGVNDRYFKFNFGFKLLSKFLNVLMFSAEYELTQAYQGILERAIGWHPCGLISSWQLEDIKKYSEERNGILLYLGDAKENKGFMQLPSLIEELTRAIKGTDKRFILQYTVTNDSKELASVDKALLLLQAADSRIVVYRDFLTEDAMHQLWLSTGHVVFNYDEITYQSQSSGVLWLAAAYKTTLYFMTNTWMNREAKRLGCEFHYSKNIEQLKMQLRNNQNRASRVQTVPLVNDEYPQRLFSDFGEWLVTKINLLQGQ